MKSLIQKLKTSFIGASLIGALYFNANAQEKNNEDNYKPKYNTIAHKMLMIEDSADNIPNNTFPTLKTLDNLIDNAKNYLPKKAGITPYADYSEEEIKEISKQIYHQIIYGNMPEINQREDFCYRASLVYLAISQVYNLHFYAFMLPLDINKMEHMSIRCDKNGKHDPLNSGNPVNAGDINIEATAGEIQSQENFSDEYYMKKHCLKKEDLEKNNYLKNLNERELLSIAYSQRWTSLLFFNEDRKENPIIPNLEAMIKDYNRAIDLDPKSFSAFFRMGLILNLKGEHEKAIENFKQALEISKNPKTYDLIAGSYASLREYGKAIQEYTNALNLIEDWKKISLHDGGSLDANKSIYLSKRSHLYKKLGDKEKANQDYKNLKEIYLKYAEYNLEKFPIDKADSVITSIYGIKKE